jgi:type I restriction enzyme, S subunit
MAETKNTKAFYNTEIPRDWEVAKIGEFGKVFTGNTPDTSDIENYSGDFLFVSPGDLSEAKYIERTEKTLSEKGFLNSRKFPKGSVLFTCIGSTIGKSGIATNDLTANQQINAIVVNDNNSNEFLYYQLEKNVNRIKLIAGEQAVPIINKSQFEVIKIVRAPLPEQKSIARVLSTWDEAIHKTEKLIAQKELRKKWMMQNLLTGKMRLKGFGGEWKEKKLSDLFDRVTRKNTEGNTTVVTISAQRGFVRQTDFFNKNIASEITENYFLVDKGEFCYNKSYSNGYPWGATKRLNDFDKAVVTTLYICFGVKDEKKTNPVFFEHYFGANHLDKGLTKIAHEGGRAHGLLNVTPSDFFSLKITVPTYEEQTAIAQILQAADKEINLFKAKAEKLRKQKRGLMQKLLTGKIRIK